MNELKAIADALKTTNRFKVEKELDPKYTPKPDDEVEVMEMDLSGDGNEQENNEERNN